MSPNLNESLKYFKNTLKLMGKSLYKTVEFQLLFKLLYIGIILFIVHLVIKTLVNIIETLTNKVHLNETIQNIPFLSLIEIKTILALCVSLFIIGYIYLVEKNGVLIITSKYYQNNFISFLKVLLISIQRTPLFIFRRIVEMKISIMSLIGCFIIWKITSSFSSPTWTTTSLIIILILIGAWIFFSIIFRNTFTAYITCLEPNEIPKKFNSKIPKKILKKRLWVSIIFYTIFSLSILIWLFLFLIIIKILIHFSTIYPDFISTAIAFFIAFTIISVLVALSLLKTFKSSLMTLLYYQEHREQKRKITIYPPNKQPFLSKKPRVAILVILISVLAGGIIISTSIKSKTDKIMHNAQIYIEENKEQSSQAEASEKKLDLQEIIKESISNKNSPLDAIEDIVFAYFTLILVK